MAKITPTPEVNIAADIAGVLHDSGRNSCLLQRFNRLFGTGAFECLGEIGERIDLQDVQ